MTLKKYGIGAVARDTGCHVETIRYYEKIALLPEPPRSHGGHRQYSADATKRVSFIVRSREIGFSIADIRQLLNLIDSGVSCESVQQLTLSHLIATRAKIADLEKQALVLEDAAAGCAENNSPDCPILDVLYDGATTV